MSPKPALRVVEVEDSPTDAKIVSALLHNEFMLTSKTTLRSGLEEVQRNGADLVLLDLGLPDAQGLSAVQVFHREIPSVPLIVLTGNSDPGMADEARRMGAHEVLTKGNVKSQALRALVRRVIADHATHARLAASCAELEGLKRDIEQKNHVIQIASHEILTPLTPMRMKLHLLKSGTLGPLLPPQSEALQVIDRNMARLMGVVEDHLDASRLGRNALRITPTRVDLAGICREAQETHAEPARLKAIEIVFSTLDPVYVRGDSARLSQVLGNLVSNAIKYTPAGGRVDLVIRQASDAVFVECRDTGLGLSADQIAKLFQPFTQCHEGHPGSGLGLYISRGIALIHGGDLVALSSGAGCGATFTLRLPATNEPTP